MDEVVKTLGIEEVVDSYLTCEPNLSANEFFCFGKFSPVGREATPEEKEVFDSFLKAQRNFEMEWLDKNASKLSVEAFAANLKYISEQPYSEEADNGFMKDLKKKFEEKKAQEAK